MANEGSPLDDLRRENEKLTRLLDDPHPGLSMWMLSVAETVESMADIVGYGPEGERD